MKVTTIHSFKQFIAKVESFKNLGNDALLFRGQSEDKPLLPLVARRDSQTNTTETEKEMLGDLKRRSNLLINKDFKSDWEWLVLAQHFGLHTRLLDWTSNPLVALWFACSNLYKMDISSYVYVFEANKDFLLDEKKNEDPFLNSEILILRPQLNNERVIAQAGWFTAHTYDDIEKQFVSFEENSDVKSLLTKIEIPAAAKKELLKKLSIFGVNHRTMYPDLSGLCLHLNWKYFIKEL